MSTRATEAESVLKEHMGYLPVSEMERRGVSRTEISRFVREAKLEKAAKGLGYSLFVVGDGQVVVTALRSSLPQVR